MFYVGYFMMSHFLEKVFTHGQVQDVSLGKGSPNPVQVQSKSSPIHFQSKFKVQSKSSPSPVQVQLLVTSTHPPSLSLSV